MSYFWAIVFLRKYLFMSIAGLWTFKPFCACARCILTWDLAKSRLGAKLHAIYSFRFLHRSWVRINKPPRGNSIACTEVPVTILFAYRSCTLLRNWHRSSVAVRCQCTVQMYVHSLRFARDLWRFTKCALIDWLIDSRSQSSRCRPTTAQDTHCYRITVNFVLVYTPVALLAHCQCTLFGTDTMLRTWAIKSSSYVYSWS